MQRDCVIFAILCGFFFGYSICAEIVRTGKTAQTVAGAVSAAL